MLTSKIGYVMAAHPDTEVAAATEAGTWPRHEFGVFLRRNKARILSFRDLDASQLTVPKILNRPRLRYWGLATNALTEQAKFDAFVATGEDVGLPLALTSWVNRGRTPVYIITHGSFFGSPRFRLLMFVLRRNERVHYLCLSKAVRRDLIERFGVRPSHAHNTGYGVDTGFFRPPAAALTAPVIVSAGTANRDYGTLIRAAAPLRVPIRIAADSAWFPTQVDVGSQLPAEVEIRSYGNYQRLRELYASASLVVVPLHPAKHACGYAVIAEAMAMGKPVIATRTDVHSDFIIDGETGFYVEPGDVEGLQDRISYLLANPDIAGRMGQAARQRMETLFSVESYCERIERVIQSTAPKNSSAKTVIERESGLSREMVCRQ